MLFQHKLTIFYYQLDYRSIIGTFGSQFGTYINHKRWKFYDKLDIDIVLVDEFPPEEGIIKHATTLLYPNAKLSTLNVAHLLRSFSYKIKTSPLDKQWEYKLKIIGKGRIRTRLNSIEVEFNINSGYKTLIKKLVTDQKKKLTFKTHFIPVFLYTVLFTSMKTPILLISKEKITL
jgi:hypothetical protein